VALGGMCSILGAMWFGTRLPAIRGEARRLIIAQNYAGGDPPQEVTAVREPS
jgi:hypothetical protein